MRGTVQYGILDVSEEDAKRQQGKVFRPEYFSARKLAKLGGRPFSTLRLLRSYRGYLLGLAVFEPVHESHWKI